MFKYQVSSSGDQFQDKDRKESREPTHWQPTLKEAKSPTTSATSMTTTRSQSLAMSIPPETSAQQEPESPESTPPQESPGSTHLRKALEVSYPKKVQPVLHLRTALCHLDWYMPSPLSWVTHCSLILDKSFRNGSYTIQFMNH